MREFLFRGKRVDNGEWVYGQYIKACEHWHRFGKHEDWITRGAIQNGGIINLWGRCAVIPETVGQYTGFKDDQDVRIFEGDIVEVRYDDDTAYLTEVRAYGNTLCVDIEGEDYNFAAIDFAVEQWREEDCCELKVISNIYDNKEEE